MVNVYSTTTLSGQPVRFLVKTNSLPANHTARLNSFELNSCRCIYAKFKTSVRGRRGFKMACLLGWVGCHVDVRGQRKMGRLVPGDSTSTENQIKSTDLNPLDPLWDAVGREIRFIAVQPTNLKQTA